MASSTTWAVLSLLLLTSAYAGNTIDCIENTGGSCLGSTCFDWRGPTVVCNGGRCFCTAGACAGGDGICSNAPYIAVGNGTKYKLKNARWPEYYMDVDYSGGVKVEKTRHDEDDNKFTLSMPTYAGGQEPLMAPVFLVASVRWPKATLRLTKSTKNHDDVFNAETQNVDGRVFGLGSDPSVMDLGMSILRAPLASSNGDVPVMLSPYKYPNMYLFVGSGGWTVQGHRNDPGAGGYWYFEPRLDASLRARLLKYTGPRCSINCGVVRSVNAASNTRTSLFAILALATVSMTF